RLLSYELIRRERLAEQIAVPPGGDARVRSVSVKAAPTASIDSEPVIVLVGARSLPRGSVIAAADLYAVPIPAQLLPDGIFTRPDQVVGRVVCEDLLADEVV